MTLHPRHDLVTKAKIDIQESVFTAIGRHDLTHAELAGIFLQIMAQYAIRDEREEEATGTGDPGSPTEHI